MSQLNRIMRILIAFVMPALVIGGAYLITHDSAVLGVVATLGGIILIVTFFLGKQIRKTRKFLGISP